MEVLEKPECEFSVLSLAVEGEKKGQKVYVCRNNECPVHHPIDESSEDELTALETAFDEQVAHRVRLKILDMSG